MPKFSDLTALTGPNVAAADLFVIDDASAGTAGSKSVRGDALLQGALVAATNKILDSNSNELVIFTVTASAVNELTVANAATGSGPTVAVTGGDTNAPLSLDAKGSGVINLNATATGNVKVGTNLQLASAKSIVDANGNEIIKTAATVASAVNELTLTNSATGDPILLAATGGDTNIGVKLDAKGSGTISLNTTGTGNVVTSVPVVITSASANAFAVGRQGTTSPGFIVDASTATCVTGVKITPAAAAAGVAVAVVSSGTNEALTLDAKGSGTIGINTVGTGAITLGTAVTCSSTITSTAHTITSASANALAVGLAGTTNPALQVDASTASSATGLQVKSAAAASGLAVSVISSGTNENLTLDSKGSGTVTINSVGTGGITLGTAVTCSSTLGVASTITGTSASASALTVGRLGATTPALQVDASTATCVTGLKVKAAAAAGGLALSVVSSGTNEALTIDSKGSGTITLNGTGTGNVTTPRGLFSTSATAGVGYATGAGGAVTQSTNRTTGVTVNTPTGAITLVSAAGSATPASFTVTNSSVAATDTIIVNQKSGTDLYEIFVTAVGAGSFRITSFTTGGTTTEQPVFNYAVIKGVAA